MKITIAPCNLRPECDFIIEPETKEEVMILRAFLWNKNKESLSVKGQSYESGKLSSFRLGWNDEEGYTGETSAS